MRWNDDQIAAAKLIDSTPDELARLSLWEVLHGLIDHTIDTDTARTALADRRRVSALITGPVVLARDEPFDERGNISLEWVNTTHDSAVGHLRSSASILDGVQGGLYGLLYAGRDDIEFDTTAQVDDAIAALTDLRDAWRALSRQTAKVAA